MRGFGLTPGSFRLILALLVVLSHSASIQLGKAAVLVFFVLSGYWICTMWNGRYSKTRWPYFTYLASRCWRLLPVFWALTMLTLIAFALTGQVLPPLDGGQIFANATLLGYASLPVRLIRQAWSLDAEMQFYLIAPAIIVLGSRWRGRGWWTVLCVGAVMSILSWGQGDQRFIWQTIGFFLVGAAAAGLGWTPRPRIAWSALAATVFLIGMCLASPYRNILTGKAQTSLYAAFNMSSQIVLALMMVPWAIHTAKQKSDRFDAMLGDLSYVIYLGHLQVLVVLGSNKGTHVERLAITAIAYVVIGVGAWMLWRYFDQPLNRMRSRWVSSRIRAVPELDIRGAVQPN